MKGSMEPSILDSVSMLHKKGVNERGYGVQSNGAEAKFAGRNVVAQPARQSHSKVE